VGLEVRVLADSHFRAELFLGCWQMLRAGDPIHQGLEKLSDEGRIVLPAYHVPVRSLPCAGVAGWSDFVLAGWCSWMIGVAAESCLLTLAWVRIRATVGGRCAAVSPVRSRRGLMPQIVRQLAVVREVS
jgi:hypothetical protein